MSTVIELLNGWGAAWTSWAWAAGVQAGLLIVLVMALARGLKGRVNPAVIHGLWILVWVKLALPPSFSLPTGLGYWALRTELFAWSEPPTAGGIEVREARDVPMMEGTMTGIPGSGEVWNRGHGGASLRWETGLLGIWALGGLVVLGCVGRAGWRLRGEVRKSVPADATWQAAVREGSTRLGLSQAPQVRLTTWLNTPAVCGLGRGVILIPASLVPCLDFEARRDVLLHELAHLRRGDLWFGHAEALLLVVYWWHPLAWITRARLQRIREEIADTLVVTEGQRDAGHYAETLLKVAKSVVKRPALSLGLMGIVPSKGLLHTRVESLLSTRVPRSPRLGWSAVLGLLVFALAALPMGAGSRGTEAGPVENGGGVEGGNSESPRKLNLDLQATTFEYGEREEWDLPDRDYAFVARAAEDSRENPPPAVRDDRYVVERFGVRRSWLKNGVVRMAPQGVTLEPGEGSESSLLFTGETAVPLSLVTRSYLLKPGDIVAGAAAAGVKPESEDLEVALKALLKVAGITFSPPSAYVFDVRTGTLVVRTDVVTLDALERLLDILAATPPAILIDARFVRVTGPGLEALMAMPEGGYEIVSAAGFQSLWKRIEQWVPEKERSARLRIQTLFGRAASVEMRRPEPAERVSARRATEEPANDVPMASLEVGSEGAGDGRTLALRLKATYREFQEEEGAGSGGPRFLESSAVATPPLRFGETVVLRLVEQSGDSPSRASGNPRATVVLVTVTAVDPAGPRREDEGGK